MATKEKWGGEKIRIAGSSMSLSTGFPKGSNGGVSTPNIRWDIWVTKIHFLHHLSKKKKKNIHTLGGESLDHGSKDNRTLCARGK